jgi:hypothetical protein
MKYSTDDLKRFSVDLAGLLRSEETIQGFTRVLSQRSAILKDWLPPPQPTASDRTVAAAPRSSDLRRIGVWEPEVKDGRVSFVRVENGRFDRIWADVERIPPKGAGPRVVFFGESVARSVFIESYFNCAFALERYLCSGSESKEVEVIDLAQAGQEIYELKEILASALALEPDAYVIFAGNNWHITRFRELVSAEDLSRIGAMLHETASWRPVRAYIETLYEKQVRGFVEYLGRLSAENRVPIIFIIPEFNLLDWRIESSWLNPLATSETRKQSLYLRALAEKELAAGNLHLVAALAEEIVEIEEGTNPFGFELLSKCHIGQGKIVEARRFKEKALDTESTSVHQINPGCYSITREVLRRECASHGITLVDLPRRFQEYLPDELPGRKFFFDYCHMNVEGIRLAMASVAEKLLPLLGCREQSWSDLIQLDFDVDRKGLAQSHVLAAYINTVYGQDYEIVRFHCAEAIRHAPEIADLMRLCIDVQVRKTNLKYVREIERLVRRNANGRYSFPNHAKTNYISLYPSSRTWLEEGLCLPFIRSMTDVLSETDSSIKSIVDDLLEEEYGVCSGEIDLLQPWFADLTLNHEERVWNAVRNHYRSHSPQSSFLLFCQSPCPVKISITCRVHDATVLADQVRLLVNGKVCHSVLAATRWVTSKWEIPAELLHEGINSIIVRWPEPKQSKKERVVEIANIFKEVTVWSNLFDIFPIYGEINEFRAYGSRAELDTADPKSA